MTVIREKKSVLQDIAKEIKETMETHVTLAGINDDRKIEVRIGIGQGSSKVNLYCNIFTHEFYHRSNYYELEKKQIENIRLFLEVYAKTFGLEVLSVRSTVSLKGDLFIKGGNEWFLFLGAAKDRIQNVKEILEHAKEKIVDSTYDIAYERIEARSYMIVDFRTKFQETPLYIDFAHPENLYDMSKKTEIVCKKCTFEEIAENIFPLLQKEEKEKRMQSLYNPTYPHTIRLMRAFELFVDIKSPSFIEWMGKMKTKYSYDAIEAESLLKLEKKDVYFYNKRVRKMISFAFKDCFVTYQGEKFIIFDTEKEWKDYQNMRVFEEMMRTNGKMKQYLLEEAGE